MVGLTGRPAVGMTIKQWWHAWSNWRVRQITASSIFHNSLRLSAHGQWVSAMEWFIVGGTTLHAGIVCQRAGVAFSRGWWSVKQWFRDVGPHKTVPELVRGDLWSTHTDNSTGTSVQDMPLLRQSVNSGRSQHDDWQPGAANDRGQ